MPDCNKCKKCSKKYACCDQCKQLLCKNCANLQESEWRCVILIKRRMKFFCELCEPNPNDSDPIDRIADEDPEEEADSDNTKKILIKENELLETIIKDKNIIINDKQKIIEVLEDKIKYLDENKEIIGQTNQQNIRKAVPSTSKVNIDQEIKTPTKMVISGKDVPTYSKTLQKDKTKLEKDEDFNKVSYKKSPNTGKPKQDELKIYRNPPVERIYGNGELSDLLIAAPERKWVWIGGLKETITLENVKQYIRDKFPNKEIDCYDLKSRYRKKCFKVGSMDVPLEDLMDPDNWPKSIIIRPFQKLPSVRKPKTDSFTNEL